MKTIKKIINFLGDLFCGDIDLRKKRYLVFVVIILVLLLIHLLTNADAVIIAKLEQNPGSFDRTEMENLAAEIRSKIKPGQKFFSCGDGRRGFGTILAKMDLDGNLKIVVQLRSNPDAGFAFSDIPMEPRRDKNGRKYLEVPSHMIFINRKVDSHWWAVYYPINIKWGFRDISGLFLGG